MLIIDDKKLELTHIDVACLCLIASGQAIVLYINSYCVAGCLNPSIGGVPISLDEHCILPSITQQHMHTESLLMLTLKMFCLNSVLMSSSINLNTYAFPTRHTLRDLKNTG